MNFTFDKNLFTQIGLDSGSLTMLCGVTHRFLDPGQYRGVVYRDKTSMGAFYINVDKESPLAQANIDLASIESGGTPPSAGQEHDPRACKKPSETKTLKFDLNPRGYAVFHVSHGAGGYAVRVSKAAEDPKQQNQFDSRELKNEDIFSAVILRPGTYSIANSLSKGKGEILVSYPKVGKTPYRPPGPVKVECSERGLEPSKLELQPGQPVLFQCRSSSRIKIELLKADDGPHGAPMHSRPGWKKAALPKQKSKG